MIEVLSTKEAKDADLYTINELNIPSNILMNNAGKAIYEEIIKIINKNQKILIILGSGGNAGDGLVIARYLYENDYQVNVLKTHEITNEDARTNLSLYKGNFVNELNDSYDIYIDAIFGIGLNKNIEGKYKEIIEKLNSYKGIKISIDIPSGLNSDNGKIMGIAFKSDYCFTVEFYKKGLFLNEGKNYYKYLKVVEANIKTNIKDDFCMVFEEKDYKNLLLPRNEVSNKGSYGRVVLIGGNKETPGAILISNNALASLKMGVGYSTICVPDSLFPYYEFKNIENTFLLFDSDKDGNIIFNIENVEKLLKYDVITIGMGIGISIEVYKIIKYLLINFKNTLIIDADGLNSLAIFGIDILKNHQPKVILTPHIKEFSRLSSLSIQEIKEDPINLVKEFSLNYKCITVLKDNVTYISNGKEIYLNINGNSSLAKGGSGDLLSGILSGTIIKSQNLIKSTCLASFILGRASDLAIKDINKRSIIATDLINYLPKVLDELDSL